jgi:uncharacterized protein YndB with AHSA1/START domain
MMTAMVDDMTGIPVRKSITVTASAEEAFRIFTDDFDSWWPRGHHIGKSPMRRAIVESRPGGRCYAEQVDGTESDWGSILVWEPPRRFVIAWQITGNWEFEPDIAKSSEVEIRFTPEPGGKTRVDLEHRFFERLTSGGGAMRNGVNGGGGWGSLLRLFADRIEQKVVNSET